jgi:hypothetical protein
MDILLFGGLAGWPAGPLEKIRLSVRPDRAASMVLYRVVP